MGTDASIERFRGLAAAYDAVRPTPPLVIVDVLCELARAPMPELVIDLGSGTGLSTRLWASRAKSVIGVEPNDEMRRHATFAAHAPEIQYVNGYAENTTLAGTADVITCVQSLHWMDPDSTFAEVDRLLRHGGVFAAIDCDWPPFVDWQLDALWTSLHEDADRLVAERGLAPGLKHWDKSEHLTGCGTPDTFGSRANSRSITETTVTRNVSARLPAVRAVSRRLSGTVLRKWRQRSNIYVWKRSEFLRIGPSHGRTRTASVLA